VTEVRSVIGHGLLGTAIESVLGSTHPLPAIPWPQSANAQAVLRSGGVEISTSGSWSVAWCAGLSVVGTSGQAISSELAAFESFLEGLEHGYDSARPGALFLASSAGGIYAHNTGETLSEVSREAPTSDYGRGKLALEATARRFASRTGAQLLIGRISNLYGPRQNVSKPQGFISHLCRSLILKKPFVLSVPPDTTRDFLHANDAAARVCAWLRSPEPLPSAIKILASGRSVNLGQVISTASRVTGLRPHVLFARNDVSHLQPRHLRFSSRVLLEHDRQYPARTLESGIAETWSNLLAGHVR